MTPAARVSTVVLLAACLSACAHAPTRDRLAPARCEFAVYNHTTYALDVRMAAGPRSPRSIGALNPGEVLIHGVPCADRAVWVGGFPLLREATPPIDFAIAGAASALVEGTRVDLPLYGP